MTTKEILAIKLKGRLDEWTIGTFLRDCMVALIEEGEGFSGKRPICDSGWERDIAIALVEAGAIPGKVTRDQDGYIDDEDYEHSDVNRVIREALEELFAQYDN